MKYPQGLRLLIDGDIVKYRCAFAAEKTHYLVEQPLALNDYHDSDFTNYQLHKDAKTAAGDTGIIWSRKEIQPVEFAINATNTLLESFVSKFQPSILDVYLSDSPTFRDSVAKTKPYKGNRADTARPAYYNEVGEYLLSRGAIIRSGLEADDCLSVESSLDRNGTIILSIDKDLLQVEGNHYNWVKDEFVKQSKKSAHFSLATQLLTGDTTDNIPGLAGIGPVAAKKILGTAKDSVDLFGRVLHAYQERGGDNWMEYFVEQFKLIKLLSTYEEKDLSPEIEAFTGTKVEIRTALQGAA